MHNLISTLLFTIPANLIRFSTRLSLLSPIILGLTLLIGLSALFSIPVMAAPTATISLDVDTTLDSNEAAYQACTTADGDCSLRGAISVANADTGNDYVISLPEGTFAFSLSGSDEDNNATGDLDLSGNIILSGVSAISTTIDANQRDRGLHVLNGAVVVLENLTLTTGKAPDGADGNGTSGGTGVSGGGIYNEGSLAITRSILQDNQTGAGGLGGSDLIIYGQPGGNGGLGGAVYNTGQLEIRGTTLSGNQTGTGGDGGPGGVCMPPFCPVLTTGDGGRGGDGGDGGAIYNAAGGTLTVTNSTLNNNLTGNGGDFVDSNSSGDGAGDAGSGAGIYNAGTIAITTSTLSGNITGNGGDGRDNGTTQGPAGGGGHGGAIFTAGSATLENLTLTMNRTGTTGSIGYVRTGTTDGLGAGIYVGSGPLNYQNTIIAGNDSPVDANDDCYGTLTSLGYNLVGSGTGCPVGTNDQATSNALLGPLADHGGETQTHALLTGSPAIDQIPDGVSGCIANTSADQRSAVRAGGTDRGGDRCDIGAYEYDSGETPNLVTLKEFSASPSDYFIVLISIVGLLGTVMLTIWKTHRKGIRSIDP